MIANGYLRASPGPGVKLVFTTVSEDAPSLPLLGGGGLLRSLGRHSAQLQAGVGVGQAGPPPANIASGGRVSPLLHRRVRVSFSRPHMTPFNLHVGFQRAHFKPGGRHTRACGLAPSLPGARAGQTFELGLL